MTRQYPQADTFPGLDIRRVDMGAYNTPKGKAPNPNIYRQLSYYRAFGPIPLSSPNLHACAHLYASDRNSLFLINNALDFGQQLTKMGSLSHSVVFHVDSKDLIVDEERWFCQEAWTPRSGGGRGMHESKIWNEEGLHIATSWQEGLVKGQGEEAKEKALERTRERSTRGKL